MTSDDFKRVTALMEAYFDGLYHADSTRLRTVFHPNLAYICATEGDELYLDLDSYMARVDKRVPPAQKGEKRKDVIHEISFASPRLAHVKARMTLMERDYIDYLTLTRLGDEWRVITKVFTYVPKEDA